ncbi:FAD:protein FMN transferase [Agromyces soli]|uniref:FAD:protein FMN transferase n=1 Tax=Agromyces soli TaxID=659012 RepID=A0ABY4AWE5_9MICO|nr:FAD:protein FMN transferase [Agromyces soli]UOE27503.1 FAD:protein FMN transferase [Agromyces soli]
MTPVQTRVAELMGTVASVRVVGDPSEQQRVSEAIDGCLLELADLEHRFSTYRADSEVSRFRRGEFGLEDASPLLAEVASACEDWTHRTGGRFSAWFGGDFDPTGFVKGWATERAARRHLAPLCELPGVVAAGISVGGDVQLFRAPGQQWCWRIGIADPRRPGAVLATLELGEGAVATSGLAERGDHLVDPRNGVTATSVLSATVVADGLTRADVWATAACIAGDELGWLAEAGTIAGLLVAADGGVRRWAGTAELVPPSEEFGPSATAA